MILVVFKTNFRIAKPIRESYSCSILHDSIDFSEGDFAAYLIILHILACHVSVLIAVVKWSCVIYG